jgi:hypothetical protein
MHLHRKTRALESLGIPFVQGRNFSMLLLARVLLKIAEVNVSEESAVDGLHNRFHGQDWLHHTKWT